MFAFPNMGVVYNITKYFLHFLLPFCHEYGIMKTKKELHSRSSSGTHCAVGKTDDLSQTFI